jgi:hypothetical protein
MAGLVWRHFYIIRKFVHIGQKLLIDPPDEYDGTKRLSKQGDRRKGEE